jgi:hypothetical protein
MHAVHSVSKLGTARGQGTARLRQPRVRPAVVGSPAVVVSWEREARLGKLQFEGRLMRFLDSPGLSARRAVALAAVVVITLFAAGCSKADPSVVAYVGTSRITEQQVDDAVEGVSSILQEGQAVSRSAIVNSLIHGLIAEKVAATNKITITDSERDALIKDSNLAGLLTVPKGRPVAYDLADQQIVSGKVGSEAYLAAVSEQQVTLNPRFGVLDPKQKLIITDQSASLAEPAPTQTP